MANTPSLTLLCSQAHIVALPTSHCCTPNLTMAQLWGMDTQEALQRLPKKEDHQTPPQPSCKKTCMGSGEF